MPATAEAYREQDFDEDERVSVEGRVDAGAEDAFWEHEYRWEGYYSRGLDYEDYAPAYCVGYIGYAQYGGDFADAEKSLCANWERIKGDSRLTLDQAMPAMRAAWDKMAQPRTVSAGAVRFARKVLSLRAHLPSIKLSPSMAR